MGGCGRPTALRGLGRLAPALAAAAFSLTGCGGGTSDQAKVGTQPPGRTATAPSSAPRPATGPAGASGPSSGATGPSGGGEEPIRVPVTLVFRGGGVDPPTVTVPAFVAVEVSLVSGDGRAHVLRFHDGRRSYRLAVGAGRRETTKLPGLRAGTYRLRPLGDGRGVTLTVGGEAGP